MIIITMVIIHICPECGSQVQVPLKEGDAALHRAQWRGGNHDDWNHHDDDDHDPYHDQDDEDGGGDHGLDSDHHANKNWWF